MHPLYFELSSSTTGNYFGYSIFRKHGCMAARLPQPLWQPPLRSQAALPDSAFGSVLKEESAFRSLRTQGLWFKVLGFGALALGFGFSGSLSSVLEALERSSFRICGRDHLDRVSSFPSSALLAVFMLGFPCQKLITGKTDTLPFNTGTLRNQGTPRNLWVQINPVRGASATCGRASQPPT